MAVSGKALLGVLGGLATVGGGLTLLLWPKEASAEPAAPKPAAGAGPTPSIGPGPTTTKADDPPPELVARIRKVLERVYNASANKDVTALRAAIADLKPLIAELKAGGFTEQAEDFEKVLAWAEEYLGTLVVAQKSEPTTTTTTTTGPATTTGPTAAAPAGLIQVAATRMMLNLRNTAKPKEDKDLVKTFQELARDKGIYEGVLDGKYGTKTARAAAELDIIPEPPRYTSGTWKEIQSAKSEHRSYLLKRSMLEPDPGRSAQWKAAAERVK